MRRQSGSRQARCVPERDGDERVGGCCHQREKTRSCEMQTLRKSPEIKGLKRELRHKAIEFLKNWGIRQRDGSLR